MRLPILAILLLLVPTLAGAETARVSWYGPFHHGRLMANQHRFDQWAHTVAHKTLPFGTVVEFSKNGRAVVAVVTDRGPFKPGRIFDLSRGTARSLNIEKFGVTTVQYTILHKPTRS